MDYFQDLIQGNHCFGCGPHNPAGLQIKSTWSGEKESVCVFQPSAHHCAAPTKFLNGGIIATIIDCHSVCTAIAYAYRQAGPSAKPSGILISRRTLPVAPSITLQDS